MDERGIGFSSGFETRLPRTLFFSAGTQDSRLETNMQMADVVWRLSTDGVTTQAGGSRLTSDGWGLSSAAELAEINADLASSVANFALAGVSTTLSFAPVPLDPLGLFSGGDEGAEG